ncbi:MAG: amino acid decarboxylase [Candidatus Eisenbacteria bacterium]|uniref:Amino acid decarboxylase n=1 Tax=Eiseniibacteriota bacterium TaxID=2212470 RepID=A0A948RX90_UNCEI|nr:amino acid decarboxylase [Candidatus Eisenbacteria bacterium]MBU1949821.1 amino acid decarboxylase [Candidatus Eisenbacteria bacterium]MBU2692720.1 amino acid decarboxylase [Candidatus Eisenbacteria bacterium]
MTEKRSRDSAVSSTGDIWSSDEFQEYGDWILNWISHYFSNPQEYPVLAKVQPGEIRKRLPQHPPNRSEPMENVWSDFQSVILPGITHWNHPGFMAYFGITGSQPGILAETLSAALNVNGMLWKASPAATELEEVTLDWLRQLLGLPSRFWGVIQDTASLSSLVAMIAARQTIPGVRDEGLCGRSDLPPLRYYISQEAHSSIEKAGIVLGIGRKGVCSIPSDKNFRMDTRLLEKSIRADLDQGIRPFAVVATAGTTSTTSVDPLDRIAEICRRYKLWFHVDAAYAGAAALLPEKRELFKGWERADSIVVNPHKWLFCPIDLSVLYCRKPQVIREALSLVPAYLETPEADEVVNFMDYGVALGRRFRSLKLWFVLRTFGREGLQTRLQEHIRLAQQFSRWVGRSTLFRRMAPTPFSTVCFRLEPRSLKATPHKMTPATLDKLNETLLRNVNASGEIFISSTRLRGRTILRLAIGNIRTDERYLRRTCEILEAEAKRLLK